MKFLASFLLTFLSLASISQPLSALIEANVENNQGLEIPIEIQLFSENESYYFDLITNTNGFGTTVIQTDGDWFQGIGLMYNCNDELVVSALVPSDIPEVDYTLSFDYCAVQDVFGCTDSTALNYNPLATIDDGSCLYDSTSCEGADAVLLINNSLAAQGSWDISNTDGEVFLEGNLEPEFSDYSVCLEDGCYTLNLSDINISNEGSNGFFTLWVGEALGANDWIQAGSSSYDFIVGSGCDDWISGCTDSLAINYNPDAVFDDGTCEYPPAENDLCVDATYIEPGEYIINNSEATNNEGIWGECWNFGSGEGEQSSVWYSFTTPEQPASIHLEAFADGTNSLMDTQFGLFLECGGEMIYCDGNSGAGLLSAFHFECGELEPATNYILMIDGWNGDAGTAILGYEVSFDCDSVIPGCTDPLAINYNPDATEDDGSCIYEECDANLVTLFIETATWADEMSWNVVQDGVELYGDGNYENNSEYLYELCLEDGCYTFEMFDSFGDGWNGGFFTIALGDTTIVQGTLLSGEYQSVNFGINTQDCGENEVFGCTDPAAVNYNPNANVDDGSCLYVDSCQFFVEPYYVTCSSYEFFAYSSTGNIIEEGIWSINGATIGSNNSAIFFEFEEAGVYEVCFSGQVPGCGDSWVEGCSSIYIDPGCFNPCPDIYYTSSDSCTYTFSLLNADSLNNIIWFPGDGNAYEGGNDFTYTYEETGFYTICVSYEDSDCQTETCVELYAQSCEGDVFGCTDSLAINYNPQATVDDGSCLYDSDCNGIEGALILDSGFEVSGWWGITDTETGQFVTGDTIQGGINYFDLCLEDGCYSIYLDLNANLQAEVSLSLVFGNEDVFFVTIPAGEYNFGFEVGSGCEGEVLGCMDPEAENYNPDATIDDGSCEYECDANSLTLIIETGTWANEISWNVVQDGVELYGGGIYENDSQYQYELCLENGCYAFEMFDSFGDGWNGAWFTIFSGEDIITQGTLQSGEFGSVNFGVNSEGCGENEIYGCTDPQAVNYNPDATIDDGSCVYEFDCNVGFAIIPDTTGENTIWIIPTFEVDNLVEILWDFGDGTTSSEVYPVHEYAGDGPYTLCLTAVLESEGTTCEATFCAEISGAMLGSGLLSSGFSINVISNEVLSVSEQWEETQIELYPNPATNRINLAYDSRKSGIELIRIYDITGKVVDEMQFNISVGKNRKFIDIEHLPNGVYVLSLHNISNQRFVKSD